MRLLDRIASVAVIVAVAVFLAIVVRGGYLKEAEQPVDTQKSVVGTLIQLPGVQYPPQRDTLILGISATCHFCQESVPFYKQLLAKTHGRVNVIAVMPQPQKEAEAFLKAEGLSCDQVVSAQPSASGIRGTPTLLLVDSTGKVKSAWVGKLSDSAQQEVASAVQRS